FVRAFLHTVADVDGALMDVLADGRAAFVSRPGRRRGETQRSGNRGNVFHDPSPVQDLRGAVRRFGQPCRVHSPYMIKLCSVSLKPSSSARARWRFSMISSSNSTTCPHLMHTM